MMASTTATPKAPCSRAPFSICHTSPTPLAMKIAVANPHPHSRRLQQPQAAAPMSTAKSRKPDPDHGASSTSFAKASGLIAQMALNGVDGRNIVMPANRQMIEAARKKQTSAICVNESL